MSTSAPTHDRDFRTYMVEKKRQLLRDPQDQRNKTYESFTQPQNGTWETKHEKTNLM